MRIIATVAANMADLTDPRHERSLVGISERGELMATIPATREWVPVEHVRSPITEPDAVQQIRTLWGGEHRALRFVNADTLPGIVEEIEGQLRRLGCGTTHTQPEGLAVYLDDALPFGWVRVTDGTGSAFGHAEEILAALKLAETTNDDGEPFAMENTWEALNRFESRAPRYASDYAEAGAIETTRTDGPGGAHILRLDLNAGERFLWSIPDPETDALDGAEVADGLKSGWLFEDEAGAIASCERWLRVEMETSTIDGRYIVQPEGSAWVFAEIKGGRLVGFTEESCVGTHAAARDSYSGLADLDLEALEPADLSPEDHVAVVRLAMRRDDCGGDGFDVFRIP